MMIKNKYSLYKSSGILLIILSISGYLFVADESGMGDFIGVSGALFAGIVLLFAGSRIKILSKISIQWLAFGVLAGIPLGGFVSDNMMPGTGIGIAAGILAAFISGRRKTLRTANENK